MFSIYGKDLGPALPCVRNAGPFSPDGPNSPEQLANVERTLPVDLCGVQVLIDEEPAPLIYVHQSQINFVVRGSRSFGNRVMLRVVHDGVSSIPIAVKCGPERMWLYQEQPAYTGMPVWLRLYLLSESRTPVELPFRVGVLWSTECPHIEVKYNGVLLPVLQPENPPRVIKYSGPPCPAPPVPDRQSLAGRIPLHLRYRMDRPGTYFARYVPGSAFPGFGPTTAGTQWTPVELKAGSNEQRRKWLIEKRRSAPTDPEGLLYDFLPSVFGYGDSEALQIGLEYLYNPDASVGSSTAGYLRDYYSASALIPTLEKVERQRGKSKIVERLLGDIGAKIVGR